ncbi:MAG: ParD-like family protein [Actinomycetia bacterium]|nr:ParD-like family protein [Actinomycetes bacterium]
MTMPVRVPVGLFQSARLAGVVNSRSAAQQIDHWARIGRELEASSGVSQRDIERVLAGDGSYDALAAREQAVVRAAWAERFVEGIARLDLAAEFAAAGETWSEADATGRVVLRNTAPAGR